MVEMEEINIVEIPDKFYHVNKDGSFNEGIIENKRLENSQYWASKSQEIGLLMLGSMGGLIVFLLVETDVFNFFWGKLFGL